MRKADNSILLNMEQCQNFSSEHKQPKNKSLEMDQTRRFNQNYSANKICCYSTKENSPFIKQHYLKVKEQKPTVQTSDERYSRTIRKSSFGSNEKKLEKYQPSVEKPPSVVGNKIISDKKSVFNKIDITSISVRKFNLDICEEPCNM